jgi:lipid-A-disaccharide synthase
MRIALVAGEASGDLLGAGLIRAIRDRIPDAQFEGVAGPEMVAAGCVAIENSEALAVFGLFEVLREVPRLSKLRRNLIRRWKKSPPDVFIGIDAPDFNLGLEKALRKAGIRTAHYVSPSVWAWRPGRIKTIRNAVDLVLCILPFEKDLYASHDVKAVFVGHPRATSTPTDISRDSVRQLLALDSKYVVAVLPGSRGSEVSRLGGIFAGAAAKLAAMFPDLEFVTPIASPKLRANFEQSLNNAGVADRFTLLDGQSEDAMAAADVVMLASGTAALESALLGKPTVAAYKVAASTIWVLRKFNLVTTKYFTLPNLLTETPLVPEFIQEEATPEALADAVGEMLQDPERCAAISQSFATLRTELALDANQRAADAVIELATQN